MNKNCTKSEITEHRFKRDCHCQVGKFVLIRGTPGDIYLCTV